MLVPLLCVLLGLVAPIAALAYLFQDQIKAEKIQFEELWGRASKVKETEVSVSGLVDKASEQQLNSMVSTIPGIRKIRVSTEEGTAVISFDRTKISLPEITNRMSELGYGEAC